MKAITKYLAEIGAKGGKATSKAKAKAAKANGKLGGRPKKTPQAKKRTSSGSNSVYSYDRPQEYLLGNTEIRIPKCRHRAREKTLNPEKTHE